MTCMTKNIVTVEPIWGPGLVPSLATHIPVNPHVSLVRGVTPLTAEEPKARTGELMLKVTLLQGGGWDLNPHLSELELTLSTGNPEAWLGSSRVIQGRFRLRSLL